MLHIVTQTRVGIDPTHALESQSFDNLGVGWILVVHQTKLLQFARSVEIIRTGGQEFFQLGESVAYPPPPPMTSSSRS